VRVPATVYSALLLATTKADGSPCSGVETLLSACHSVFRTIGDSATPGQNYDLATDKGLFSFTEFSYVFQIVSLFPSTKYFVKVMYNIMPGMYSGGTTADGDTRPSQGASVWSSLSAVQTLAAGAAAALCVNPGDVLEPVSRAVPSCRSSARLQHSVTTHLLSQPSLI
jgi:hypothetical protein